MKTVEEYMQLPYTIELTPDMDEGGFVASYPDLPGCLSIGDTAEEAVANAIDAKRAWLEAALEDGIEIQEPVSLKDYSGQFKLRIEAGRCQHEPILCIPFDQEQCGKSDAEWGLTSLRFLSGAEHALGHASRLKEGEAQQNGITHTRPDGLGDI